VKKRKKRGERRPGPLLETNEKEEPKEKKKKEGRSCGFGRGGKKQRGHIHQWSGANRKGKSSKREEKKGADPIYLAGEKNCAKGGRKRAFLRGGKNRLGPQVRRSPAKGGGVVFEKKKEKVEKLLHLLLPS